MKFEARLRGRASLLIFPLVRLTMSLFLVQPYFVSFTSHLDDGSFGFRYTPFLQGLENSFCSDFFLDGFSSVFAD